MVSISKILKKAPYLTSDEAELVTKTYSFAKECHKGQTRKSGEPYFDHSANVALYLTEYKADAESICAALLHDTLEDTSASLKEIEKLCGKAIATLVEGVTKFEARDFRDNIHLERKIETLRKLFTVMEKDIRVIIIKLCDRLHNMRTLDALSEERQIAFARETLDVYVKIADRLCMQRIKNKLEELCIYYLDKELHDKFLKAEKACLNNKKLIQKVTSNLEEKDRDSIIFKIRFVPIEIDDFKQGIYEKNDYFCSITTKSSEDCYKLVFYIHSLWESIRSSFRDYINRPKINGHRALYSKVLINSIGRVYFRIQTKEWENYYMNGITTYCFSELQRGAKHNKKLGWMEQLQNINKNTKGFSETFWKGLQNDILQNTILVYGDNHEGIIMPENSTALDAAFYLYGDKALRLKEIHVNNNPVPLFHKIHSLDFITCIFDSEKTVKFEWLENIETIIAKGFIQNFLHKREKEKKEAIGKELLQQEFIKHQKGFINEISQSEIERVLKVSPVSSLNKLYNLIGEGKVSPEEAFVYFFPSEKRKKKKSSHKITVTLHKDSMLDVIALLPNTPDTRINFAKCLKDGCTKLFANVFLRSDSELKEIIRNIKRVDNVIAINDEDTTEKRRANIYTGVLLTLWGLDPIFAHLLLNTGIQPLSFASLRFLIISVLLGIVVLFSFKRIKIQTRLSTLHWSFILSIVFLIATSCATYFSLASTLPSNYLITVLTAVIIAYIINNLRTTKNLLKRSIGINLAGMAIVILLFFLFSDIPLHIQILTLSVPILFVGYTLSSEKYRKTEKIEARSVTAIFLIHLIGCLLFLPAFFTIPWSEIELYQYALMIGFFTIFSVIPYVLFATKTREISHPLLIICFSIVVIGQILIESGITPIFATILKLSALLFTTALIIINNYSKKAESIKFISQNILRR